MITVRESLTQWKAKTSRTRNYYESIDILRESLYAIEHEPSAYEEEDFSILRDIHKYAMECILGVSRPNYHIAENDENRSYFPELTDLKYSSELKILKPNPVYYALKINNAGLPELNFPADFSDQFGLDYEIKPNSIAEEIYKKYRKIIELQEFLNSSDYITNFIKEADKLTDAGVDLFKNMFTCTSDEDLLTCYYYIPAIGETEESHEKLLLKLFAKIIPRQETLISIVDRYYKRKRVQRLKDTTNLSTPNNNAANTIFGKSSTKLIPEQKKTPFYETAEKVTLEDISFMTEEYAMDIIVGKHKNKDIFGKLAVLSSVEKNINKERFKPIASSNLDSFDFYVYANTISCLKQALNTRVNIDDLITAFSSTKRIRGETEFKKQFVASLLKMRDTTIVYQYPDKKKNRTVGVTESVLNFTTETYEVNGEKQSFITLHNVPKFFELAEEQNQIISIPAKLYKVEYSENGKKKTLSQTITNIQIMNHLLQHIYKFKYHHIHKREGAPENFNRILIESIFDSIGADTKLKRSRAIDTVFICLDFWKMGGYIDYEPEKVKSKGGYSYIAIHLKYPTEKIQDNNQKDNQKENQK